MNDILDVIKTRRSMKKYKPDPVPADLLDKIIDAGLYAASGMNRQDAIIIAVTDKEVRDKLSATNAAIMGSEGDPFYGAPAVLIVLAKKENRNRVYDGSLVMGNLMLAAHSLDLGSCWIHRARETFELPEWQEWLASVGVEGAYEGIGHCIVGYGDVTPPERERKAGRVFKV